MNGDVRMESKVPVNTMEPTTDTFRHKLLVTACSYFNVLTFGMVYGQIGPALPDLQIVTSSSLQQVTWLFTGFGIGFMAGCLLVGIVQEKFNNNLVLVASTLGSAVTAAVLPWIPVIYVSTVVMVVQGISLGSQFTMNVAITHEIWKESIGPFSQVTYVTYALGGFISPLYTKPFFHVESANRNVLDQENTTNQIANVSANATSAVSTDTNIQYAFLISAILAILAAIPFLILFIFKTRDQVSTDEEIEDHTDTPLLSEKYVYIIVGLSMVTTLATAASSDLFPYFLTTFVIEQLDWTQDNGSDLTSVFFITYSVANLLGILILKYSTTNKLIVASYSGAILGLVLSIVAAEVDISIVMWIATAFIGAGQASITPTLFTWLEENVTHVSGRVTSALLFFEAAGIMVQPLLLGYLMDNMSAMWFLYISLGCMCIGCINYISSLALLRIFSQSKK